MKKLLTMVVVLIVAAALFTSCGPQAGGGSDDGSSSGTSGTQGNSGNSGNSGSGSSGSSAITYIFNANELTTDCSENDFDDFLDATGNYQFQIVYSIGDEDSSEMTYSYQGKYTIDDGTAGEQKITELIETLYVKYPGLSDSTAPQGIKENYEAQGFTVTINGDTAICVNSDAIDNPSSAVPEISHTLYSGIETCKISSNKRKLYFVVDGIVGEIQYYLQKLN